MTAGNPNNIPSAAEDALFEQIEVDQSGSPSVSHAGYLKELSPDDTEIRKKVDARTEYLNSIKLLLS
ncbi:MAG: hypothetical protein JSS82_16200 [Bacteroidetes bacterium]|nr:hypothetical protein [Bacteroidota bacterium]